jgi:ABC-2 type transport system permease protein
MRYLRVLGNFYRASILTDLEYRANFLTQFFLSILNIFWSFAGLAIFFLHTDQIGDWSFHEALIVLGLFELFFGLMEMLLQPNMQDIIELIRNGTMDFILTKPINSQFHVSVRRINIWRFTNVIMGTGLIIFALMQLHWSVTLDRLLLFFVLLVCAGLILYSLIFLLITSAFWFVQLENVMELIFTFYEAGRFPVNIFPFAIRVILTFVVPIAFITTIPASVLLGRLNIEFVFYSLAITGVLFMITVLFWQYAVRHYSSARS